MPTAVADDHLADEVPPHPLRPPLADAPLRREQHRGVHEGEGQAVVEPGLRGQREADLVGLLDLVVTGLRPRDLDVGGQHGVGRSQRGAQQKGCGGSQAGPPAEEGDGPDAQGHRHDQQPPRRRPGAPRRPAARVQRSVERKTDSHQRDDDGELGDVLDRRPVVLGVERKAVRKRRQPQEQADADEDHRRRHGPATEELGQDDSEQKGAAGHEVDEVGGHACFLPHRLQGMGGGVRRAQNTDVRRPTTRRGA